VLFASVVSSNTPPQLKPVYTVFKIAMKLEKSYDCLLKVKPNLLSDFIVARQPQALMSCINKIFVGRAVSITRLDSMDCVDFIDLSPRGAVFTPQTFQC